MRNKIIVMLIMTLVILISGCGTRTITKESNDIQLTTETLLAENSKLTSSLNESLSKVNELESKNKELHDQLNKVDEEKTGIEKRLSSAQSRLLFRDVKDVLSAYSITPEPKIQNDWCYLSKGNIQIKLNGYPDAKKVKFNIIFLYSEATPHEIFVDDNAADGWVYKGDLFESKKEQAFKFNQGYLLYALITNKDGREISTEKLPFYFND